MGKRIIVVGGGPGGYAAAIKAAQLGAETILFESGEIGGTCLNSGCIPTKALLRTAGFYRSVAGNTIAGVKTTGVELDWPSVQSHKNDIVGRLTGGVGLLLRRNGVVIRREKAVPLSGGSVRVGSETLTADAVIMAVGSLSAPLSFPGSELPGVIDSKDALSLERVPKSIIIVGGGVIGVEFAALFSSLGVTTTVIEITPRLLPQMDAEIAEHIRSALMSDGVDIRTGARLLSAETAPEGLTACFDEGGKRSSVTAELLLVAAGRIPNTAGLGLGDIGVDMTRGAIKTDSYCRANIPGLYAVGDCNGKNMLAHAAMAQGETAAGHIMGATQNISHKYVPACVYSCPEAASVGMTEDQAADSGLNYKIGRFDLNGNGRAVIEGAGGFVKIIADKAYGEILGVHIAGPFATELIAEAALCMCLEGTVEDIVGAIHAHPTIGESVREAAMSVFGKPIHGL